MPYMVTFTINIPPMLAYIPYMDPMGYTNDVFCCAKAHRWWPFKKMQNPLLFPQWVDRIFSVCSFVPSAIIQESIKCIVIIYICDIVCMYIYMCDIYWLVVCNMCFSIYWECHHPNWRTHIFQRGRSTTNQYSVYSAFKYIGLFDHSLPTKSG